MNAAAPGLIAMIHGTRAAMSPASDAVGKVAPGLRLWHLLDDRLMADAVEAGGLTPALERRMTTLIDYAIASGADAVQLTCSLYGAVADEFAAPLPVRASDAAMLDRLASDRPGRVAVLASLSSSAHEGAARIAHALGLRDSAGVLVPIVIPGALELVNRGEFMTVSAAAVEAVAIADGPFDALALAQYSLAPIAAAVQSATRTPVYSPAQLMAQELRDFVDAPSPATQP